MQDIEVNGVNWFHGRSLLSGYLTRSFRDPLDAQAEEDWLDRQWSDLHAYWSSVVQLREDVLAERISMVLLMLAKDALVGMQLIDFVDGEIPSSDNLSVWLANDPNAEVNVTAIVGDWDNPQAVWAGSVANRKDLLTELSAWIADLQATPGLA